MNSKQTGHAGAFGELPAHQMPRPFWRYHEHIDVSSGLDLAKMNVETVGESEGSAGLEVGCDMFAVCSSLFFIRDEHHDNIRPGGCFRYSGYFEAAVFRFGPRFTALVKSDCYVDPAFL